MPEDLSAQLEWVARHLKQAGDTDLKKELQHAVTAATRDIPERIRDGLRPRLPNPYADALNADLSISLSRRYAGASAGVTVTARSKGAKQRKLRRLDRGVLEHPLFGDREHWYAQQVVPGWFTGPVDEAKPLARQEIQDAMDRVTAEAMRRHP